MGHFKPLQPLTGESHLFLVGQSSHGFWVARDLEGRSEGIFRNQKEAVRFLADADGDYQIRYTTTHGADRSTASLRSTGPRPL